MPILKKEREKAVLRNTLQERMSKKIHSLDKVGLELLFKELTMSYEDRLKIMQLLFLMNILELIVLTAPQNTCGAFLHLNYEALKFINTASHVTSPTPATVNEEPSDAILVGQT